MKRLLCALLLACSTMAHAGLMRRESSVFAAAAGQTTRPAFASGYTVTVYEVGAVVDGASSGTTITVEAGHGFAALDKLIVGTDTSTYRLVSSVGATSVVVSSAVTVVDRDTLVNLGPDTGAGSPNYDGSGAAIYETPDTAETATSNSRVTCDATGKYGYWYVAANVWELIRTSAGTPAAVVMNVMPSIAGPTSSTDNAIVRWDGTSGNLVQNYTSGAPTIGDTGAVTITSTLAAGATTVTGLLTADDVTATDDIIATDDLTVSDDALVSGTLDVTTLLAVATGGSTALKSAVRFSDSGELVLEGDAIPTFTSTDATPSVSGGVVFKTANASGTVITAFDDGEEGQLIIVIINDANTDFDCTSTTLKCNAGADWTAPVAGDNMTCIHEGTNWLCQISKNI